MSDQSHQSYCLTQRITTQLQTANSLSSLCAIRCSFLRFLVECQSKPVDFCVSIEDDLKLNRYEIAKLNALLEFHRIPTPMERFGPGMDTLVVYDRKQVHLMIQDSKIQQIQNPVDIMFGQLGYYTRAAPVRNLTAN